MKWVSFSSSDPHIFAIPSLFIAVNEARDTVVESLFVVLSVAEGTTYQTPNIGTLI
jgi:hypothetical protein